MTPFSYLEPETLAASLELLGNYGAVGKVLAGGQSLNLALKQRTVRPRYLISLARIPELQGTRYLEDDSLYIAAATTYAYVAGIPLRGWHSEISGVCLNLADRSVRNMGTLGGAVCQADPRFDIPTLLVAIDARLTLASTSGFRTEDASAFFQKDGSIHLDPSELLTGISIPATTRYSVVTFEKFRYRVFDAAVVNVCCAVNVQSNGIVDSGRIVVGAVRKCPIIAERSMALLAGQRVTPQLLAAVAHSVAEEVLPASTATTRLQQYQIELMRTLVRKALVRVPMGS